MYRSRKPMGGMKVRKLRRVWADDEWELMRRLEILRQQIRARGGGILDVVWSARSSLPAVSVLYDIPLGIELPATATFVERPRRTASAA